MTEKRYAILIASSEFQDQTIQNLRCPENDVDGLSELLRSKEYGNFSEVIELKNKPNHEVLLNIEQILERAERNDLVLLYYSGHGKQDRTGMLYLATANTLSVYLKSTSVSIESVKSYIAASKTNRVILILDCCYSGLAGDAFLRGGAEDQLQSLSSGRGTYIMTGSTGIQVALEQVSEKYGAFTKHIIDGIRDWKAANEDGNITMDSLYKYVHKQMLSEGFQKPMKCDLNVEGDLIIASSGKSKISERVTKIREILLDLSSNGVLPDPILSKAISVLSSKKEDLSAEEHLYYNLLDQLLQENFAANRFIEDWYNVKSVNWHLSIPQRFVKLQLTKIAKHKAVALGSLVIILIIIVAFSYISFHNNNNYNAVDARADQLPPLTSQNLPPMQVNSVFEAINSSEGTYYYIINVRNIGTYNVNDVILVDTLPFGIYYVGGTATIDGTIWEPILQRHGKQLIWRLGNLQSVTGPSGEKTIKFGVENVTTYNSPWNNTVYASYTTGMIFKNTYTLSPVQSSGTMRLRPN